jgi:hypothetical protein
VLRVLVSSPPAFRSQHDTPFSVVKLASPQFLVHFMPAVPLKSGTPTAAEGLMLALAVLRASSSEMTDGGMTAQPVYPAAHMLHADWSLLVVALSDVLVPAGHAVQSAEEAVP